MNFKKMHHIAIISSSREKAKEFYVDKLGFPIIRENYRPERDDWKIDLQFGDCEWWSDLAYYVKHYNLRLPDVFEAYILSISSKEVFENYKKNKW